MYNKILFIMGLLQRKTTIESIESINATLNEKIPKMA